VKRIAETLSISRPHLAQSVKAESSSSTATHASLGESDAELLERIRVIARERPSNGYRRVCARLNHQTAQKRVNHKRVYRVMRTAGLLLQRWAPRPNRLHEGKVITLKSDLRWCSDSFEIRCWNGEKVHVAFSLDCCDREVISWVARDTYLDAACIRDLMAQSVDARFGSTTVPHPIEWLTDNGPPYTATETRAFGAACGLLIRNTPAYSPESNGMAEALVKTFKRDYVYLADLYDAKTTLASLDAWFRDYNETHPHKGLKMLSPHQFRTANAT
jgi:putative transposase